MRRRQPAPNAAHRVSVLPDAPERAKRCNVSSRARPATLVSGMRDWTRKEFLKLAGMAAAGASLAAAGCGAQPAADPPQGGPPLLPAPHPVERQADEAGPRRRAWRQPRRRDGRGRRRSRRHGGVRQEGRRRHRQAQHLHRVPRSRVRGDHQSRGRRDPGRPLPPGRGRPRARHGPPVRRAGRGGLQGQRDPGRGGEGRRGDADHVAGRLPRLPHPRRPRSHVVADLLRRALVRRPDRRADRQGPRHRRGSASAARTSSASSSTPATSTPTSASARPTSSACAAPR